MEAPAADLSLQLQGCPFTKMGQVVRMKAPVAVLPCRSLRVEKIVRVETPIAGLPFQPRLSLFKNGTGSESGGFNSWPPLPAQAVPVQGWDR